MKQPRLIEFLAFASFLAIAGACDLKPIEYYTVSAEPPEGGTIVVSTGTGINCGEDCEEAFLPGTPIVLKAKASPGWFFRRWEGECSEQRATCRFIVNRDAQVFAVFRRDARSAEVVVEISNEAGASGSVVSNPEGVVCPGKCFGLFPTGRRVRLDANPDSLSQLDHWEGACTSTTPSCFVRLHEQRVDVKAVFVTRKVNLTVDPPTDGRIVSNPPGIDCAETCTASFDAGTPVTLTAVPDAEAELKMWTGACSGAEASCDLLMDRDVAVGADFLGMRDLQITFSGGGSATVLSTTDDTVNCSNDCTVRYRQETAITLGSSARFGSELIGWQSVCSGQNDCSFTLEDDMAIDLGVRLIDFEVSINRVGAGGGRIYSTPEGIDCGDTCSAGIPYLTRVSLTAEPELGSEFAGWAGACLGMARVCLVTVNQALNVSAYFVPQFTLTATVQGVGDGVIRSDVPGIDCGATCEAFYGRGTNVTLSATPNRGSYFIDWRGSCSGTGDCAVVLDESLTVDAHFGLLDYAFSVSVGGAGVGTVSSTSANLDCPGELSEPWNARQGQCTGTYPFKTSITLRAASAPGSRFIGWRGADCPPTDRCEITIDGDHSVQAVFEPVYVYVNPGEYLRGSPLGESGREVDEGPQLPISVNRGLWYKETEVTIGEWMRLMGSAPNPTMAANCGHTCPVQGVTWNDAVAYLNALSDFENLERCYAKIGNAWILTGLGCAGYRLPTEAEWEFAARAGGAGPFATGGLDNSGDVCNIESNLSLLGWYCGNTVTLRNVRGLNANAYGLYDMHGNVAEWTNDVYGANYYISNASNLSDPPGPVATATTGDELRTVRGGAWSDYARNCRSAERLAVQSSTASASIGFRPVRSNFALVRPGAFVMGSPSTETGHQSDEAPQHTVIHSRSYLIERTEVTQAQWKAYPGNSSNPAPSFFSACGTDCPVEMIRYDDALVYLNNLSAADGLIPCYVMSGPNWTAQDCSGYRLPTEAEWERAARAGEAAALTGGLTSGSGCTDPSADAVGWYCYNSANVTNPVRQKAPNAWGLYDVHGNVSEWVSDWYDSSYYSMFSAAAIDPTGPLTGSERGVRGGSWSSDAQEMRFGARDKNAPILNLLQVGMRTVKEYCPSAQASVLNLTGAPSARNDMSVTRAGEDQLVFGGRSLQDVILGTGAAYNSRTHVWSDLPLVNAPSARQNHTATWTGKELVVWGGTDDIAGSNTLSTGARYAPATDIWSTMSAPPISFSGRHSASSVWIGNELMIWGGHNGEYVLNDGMRYIPENDTWVKMSASPLSARRSAASVWTGEDVLIFGGHNMAGTCVNTYARYNPRTDRWSNSRTNSAGCSCASDAYLAGDHVLIVSGSGWCQFDLRTEQWTSIPVRPSNRSMNGPGEVATAVSGAELFVFGGSTQASDGVLDAYSPVAGTWRSSPVFSPNAASLGAKGIWTGCGMWMWSSDGVSSNSYYFIP